jgi:hypothetical protein
MDVRTLHLVLLWFSKTDVLTTTGPGHFLEVEKILPLLTSSSAEHPSFHVVAPSLPGYGFSEYPSKAGFGLREYAEVSRRRL